eukprot:PITA_33272
MVAGIEVRLTKSKIFFFNTDISIQRNLSRILGFQRDSLPSKCLGVPLTNKLLHKDIWEPVLNKLKDKISRWTNRALNLAGRLILTKAILQTIPIYMQSAILAPTGVNVQIRNIQRDFLWGKGEEKKKWALVAWERVCKPKSHGGLGLHDLEILNRVLGAKVWCRWLKEIQSPWAKLWKKKYAMNWQDTNLIRMTRQEGNLSSEDLASIQTDTINKGLRRVSDFWDQSRNNGKWGIWKLPVYNEMSMLNTQATTLKGLLEKRKILISTSDDQLRWGKNKAGLFTLKEAKRIATGLNLPSTNKTWKEIWDNPHWIKVKLFKWLVHQGKILTWDNLRKRGFVGPSRCHLCGQQEETTNHLLNRCS